MKWLPEDPYTSRVDGLLGNLLWGSNNEQRQPLLWLDCWKWESRFHTYFVWSSGDILSSCSLQVVPMRKKRYVQKAFMTATPGSLEHQSKVASIIQELFISVLVEPFQCLWVVVFIGHSLAVSLSVIIHKQNCHFSVEIYLPVLSLPSSISLQVGV